jgi:hypothetical protein
VPTGRSTSESGYLSRPCTEWNLHILGMDRTRKSEKPEPAQQPIEPEMQKTPEQEHGRDPATEPPKEKRVDEL